MLGVIGLSFHFGFMVAVVSLCLFLNWILIYVNKAFFAFGFRSCARSPLESIMSRVKEIGETFCCSYTQSTDEQPGSHIGME